jgi:hypothetical protein
VRSHALALLLAASLAVVACDDAGLPEMELLTSVGWNEAPASVADLGYEVNVDVGWPDRFSSCFSLPGALRVTVNDHETTSLGIMGDCRWDVVFRAERITEPGPVTVRIYDGSRMLGEAVYRDVLRGFDAKLVTSTAGRVRAGDPVTILVPDNVPVQLPDAMFFWRDSPANVPAFYTRSSAELAPDGLTITTTAPALRGQAGRAALVISTSGAELGATSECVGFEHCTAYVKHVLGPIEVEVLAAE